MPAPVPPPKLLIGEVNDPAERDADRTAERALRGPTAAGAGAVVPPPPIDASNAGAPPGDGASSHSPWTPGEAPAIVYAALRSPGHPIDTRNRRFFETRFRQDFGGVRIHANPLAADSARTIGALAYTVGSNVAFGSGQYRPETRRGRELLAHELAHVAQRPTSSNGVFTIRRQDAAAAATGMSLEDRASRPESKAVIRALERVDPDAAGGVGDFAGAFGILNGLAMFAMLATLDELKSLGEFALLEEHTGNATGVNQARIEVAMAAVHDHGTKTFDAFAAAQGDAFSSLPQEQQTDIARFLASPARQTAPSSTPATQQNPIAALSAGEKLSRALDFARSARDESWNRAIEGLKSPQSILTMATLAVAFIAAQAVPVTWIADAAALAGLTIAGFFLGVSATTFVIDIGKFFAAVAADTEEDLKRSGEALADAVSIFGVFAITGALSEGIGAGLKGANTTPLGPPPSGFADAYAPGAGIIRVPQDMVPSEAPTFPSKMQAQGQGPGGGSPKVPETKPAGNAETTGAETKGAETKGAEPSKDAAARRVTNLKHHPNSVSPEPANVDDLFARSIADSRGRRWAKDSAGVIHRFSAPSNGETHWNGSTAGVDPIQLRDIPNEIKKLLK